MTQICLACGRNRRFRAPNKVVSVMLAFTWLFLPGWIKPAKYEEKKDVTAWVSKCMPVVKKSQQVHFNPFSVLVDLLSFRNVADYMLTLENRLLQSLETIETVANHKCAVTFFFSSHISQAFFTACTKSSVRNIMETISLSALQCSTTRQIQLAP